MGRCNEAVIVVGLKVKEWKQLDLSKFIHDPKNELAGETELTKFLETNKGLSYIAPHEYKGWEEDMVVGIKVLSVYGEAIELDFESVIDKTSLVIEEFSTRFGFMGKVYFGPHEG